MRKTFILVVSALVAVSAQAQTVIYDVITPATGFTITSQAGNELAGDNFLPSDPGAGNFWRVTDITFVVFFTLPGDHVIDDLRIDLFNQVDTTAAVPAFSNLAGGFNVAIGVFNTTGPNQGFILNVPGLSIDLDPTAGNATGYGIQMSMNATTGSGIATFAYVDNGSTAGAWSNGFFFDGDDNGTINGDEFFNFGGWTNGNLAVAMTASPVPEPASMVALGLAAAALLARRRRRR